MPTSMYECIHEWSIRPDGPTKRIHGLRVLWYQVTSNCEQLVGSASYLKLAANWRANVGKVFHQIGHHVNDTFLLMSAAVTNLL